MKRRLSSAPESARGVLSLSFSCSEICVGILWSGSWESLRQDTGTGRGFGLFLGCGTSPGGSQAPSSSELTQGGGRAGAQPREPLPSLLSQIPAQSTARIQAPAAEPGLCKLLICSVKRYPRTGLPSENG